VSACLAYELGQAGLHVETQVHLPLVYQVAQVLSYLRLSGLKLGLLLNFNVPHLRQGIRRVINGPECEL
jgi:hypothetical protein